MTRQLRSFTLLLLATVVEASGPINQTTAASQCLTLYDSQLIPRMYIEDHNLTGDIIQELNPGESAWIDGKTQNIGCYQEKCLRIKMMLQQNYTKLPFICVNPKGIVDIFPSKVLYQDSMRLCNAEKFSIEFIHFALDVYELKFRIEKLVSNTIFWIPNVKTTDNSDTLCTFVTTGEHSLDTFTGNCSIHQLGICINNSYIPDYQLTSMLEMTLNKTTTNADQSKSAIEANLITDTQSNVPYRDLGIYLAVLLSVLSLIVMAILLLKKMKPKNKTRKEFKGTTEEWMKLTIKMEENDPG
nr:uncharacterized protein LOC117683005 [Crassostrea gigas]